MRKTEDIKYLVYRRQANYQVGLLGCGMYPVFDYDVITYTADPALAVRVFWETVDKTMKAAAAEQRKREDPRGNKRFEHLTNEEYDAAVLAFLEKYGEE